MHATKTPPDPALPLVEAAPPDLEPALAPPPAPSEASRRMHELFLKVNKWSTVPLLRAGLGPWLGTPIGGYLLLLRVRGRTSGTVRETPLSYLVAEGSAWVCAGFGPTAQWYQNIRADRHVEVVLPGRTIAAIAEDVRDPEIRRRMIPALVRAIGLPGSFGGVDPRHDTDEQILEAYGWVPLIRSARSKGPSPPDRTIRVGPPGSGARPSSSR